MYQVIVTDDIYNKFCLPSGLLSRKQTLLLGESWPQVRGWKKRIIGDVINASVLEKLIELKSVNRRTARKSPKKSPAKKKSHQTKIKDIAGIPLKKYSHPLLGKEEYSKFYSSTSWRQLRYLALKNTDGQCQCCGARASDGVSIHVDHIKPRSRYPELELSLDNLQVLCQDCNVGKGDWGTDDWREHWKTL